MSRGEGERPVVSELEEGKKLLKRGLDNWTGELGSYSKARELERIVSHIIERGFEVILKVPVVAVRGRMVESRNASELIERYARMIDGFALFPLLGAQYPFHGLSSVAREDRRCWVVIDSERGLVPLLATSGDLIEFAAAEIVGFEVAGRRWEPVGRPELVMSEGFRRDYGSHPRVGYPYPDVEMVAVQGQEYEGPIAKVTSRAIDPGGGGYPYVLESFEFFNASGRNIASVYGCKYIYIKDKSLTLRDIADAIEAMGVKLSSKGYTAGGLYRLMSELDLDGRESMYRKCRDAQGNLLTKDGYVWVVSGEVTYL